MEDPDDLEDLASQSLLVQFYSGSPIEASAFFDPSIYDSVTTIEGIGDLAYTSGSAGMDYSFVDEPVGGYVELHRHRHGGRGGSAAAHPGGRRAALPHLPRPSHLSSVDEDPPSHPVTRENYVAAHGVQRISGRGHRVLRAARRRQLPNLLAGQQESLRRVRQATDGRADRGARRLRTVPHVPPVQRRAVLEEQAALQDRTGRLRRVGGRHRVLRSVLCRRADGRRRLLRHGQGPARAVPYRDRRRGDRRRTRRVRGRCRAAQVHDRRDRRTQDRSARLPEGPSRASSCYGARA